MFIPLRALNTYLCADTTPGTRYALQNVLAERDGDGKPWLVATNGKALLCATWTEPDASESLRLVTGRQEVLTLPVKGFRRLLPATFCKTLTRKGATDGFASSGRRERWVLVGEDDGVLRVPMGGAIVEMRLLEPNADRRFPDYRAVLEGAQASRDAGNHKPMLVGVGLLAGLAGALDAMEIDTVRWDGQAADHAILFHAHQQYEGQFTRLTVCGGLMPLQRNGATETEVPWPVKRAAGTLEAVS